MQPLIRLKGISKDFLDHEGKSFRALENVTLDIEQGQFVSIMGPSGSGKSTLANVIGLLTRPTEGAYSFLDHECESLSEEELSDIRNRHIGFIFQDYMLVEHMTAVENVSLALHCHKVDGNTAKKMARGLLEEVGLSDHMHKIPSQLSGGQKQRVAIARALVKSPKLILADEPTGALDKRSRTEVLDLMADLHQKGSTIVMVTHSVEDSRYSQRRIEIDDSVVTRDTESVSTR